MIYCWFQFGSVLYNKPIKQNIKFFAVLQFQNFSFNYLFVFYLFAGLNINFNSPFPGGLNIETNILNY